MDDITEKFKINIKQKKADGQLYVVTFKDHEHYIAYSPSFNLSGYGDTEKEATDMFFKVILPDFCVNLFQLPEVEIFNILDSYGWSRDKFFKKDMKKIVHADNESILRIFNLSEDTAIKSELMAVA